MLPPILLAMLPKIITLLDADFNSLKDIFDGDGEALKNSAPPGHSFQVTPVANESSMIPKERLVDLRPTDPEGGLRGEWDASRFYLSTFLLRVQHNLPALPVQLV
jgi:hypothetical protein